MTWNDVLKNNPYLGGVERLMERVLAHPDFDEEEFLEDMTPYRKELYLEIRDGGIDASRTGENLNQQTHSLFIALRLEYGRLAYQRSINLLESMAKDFGIDLDLEYTPNSYTLSRVKFKYDGLDFEIRDGIYIFTPYRKIVICVVDERDLPFGDYAATVLGLIKNSPERIPTVALGIRLAKMLNRYHSKGFPLRKQPKVHLGLYTPFGALYNDNEQFEYFIEDIIALGTPQAEEFLMELEDEMFRIFGDTRNFFE